MRTQKLLWFVGYSLLCACQGLSGISSLEVFDTATSGSGGGGGGAGGAGSGVAGAPSPDAGAHEDEVEIEDAGRSGSAGDPGAAGSAGSTGGSGGAPMDAPSCPLEKDEACDWLDDCGCEEGLHCQARGADAKATCVDRGDKELGERCETPDDCSEGTCDNHICRQYCEDRCDGGRCLPATGSDGEPIPDVNVCWLSCQVGGEDRCPSGLTCQVINFDDQKAAFCLPPADPCPTVRDGHCDEPNVCAAGTDAFDCSCQRPENGECDPVAQCGCADGEACQFDVDGHTFCTRPGPLAMGELCDSRDACGAGLACIGSPYASCKPLCGATPNDCPGASDLCIPVRNAQNEDVVGFKVCIAGCADMMSCPGNHACTTTDQGPLCIPYQPEIEGAQCSLTMQLGCESVDGTGCFLSNDAAGGLTASCVPLTKRLPEGATCTYLDDCDEGMACAGHVCRRFCDPNVFSDGCDDGTCDIPEIDGVPLDFGFCLATCTSDSACDPGQVCSAPSGASGPVTCRYMRLTTDCPVNDGRCDEPQGTGLCAEGYDTADCAGAP